MNEHYFSKNESDEYESHMKYKIWYENSCNYTRDQGIALVRLTSYLNNTFRWLNIKFMKWGATSEKPRGNRAKQWENRVSKYDLALGDLQPHYDNRVSGNVYILATL